MKSKVCLIVEGEEGFRSLISKTTRSVGLLTVEVPNVIGAVNLLRAGLRPSLVIIDQRLPHKAGEILAARLRAMPGCADSKVVIVLNLFESTGRVTELGADGWVNRLLTEAELEAEICKHIES